MNGLLEIECVDFCQYVDFMRLQQQWLPKQSLKSLHHARCEHTKTAYFIVADLLHC